MAQDIRKSETSAVSVLDLLLRPEVPNVQRELPTARYKVKRLSQAAGADVIFTLRALPYGRVEELRELPEDMDVHIVLAGVAEPDLKAPELREKYGAATPAEVVKAMLLPGEIGDLRIAVEKLCGYRRETIAQVKNA